ncbi:MAG: hypothetical protein WCB03_06910 [Rouxiella badensis]|uniref:hypothetical protein n=1 Tax=Rouxiella badensis TaxID=1646377 RepID=UPI003C65FF80
MVGPSSGLVKLNCMRINDLLSTSFDSKVGPQHKMLHQYFNETFSRAREQHESSGLSEIVIISSDMGRQFSVYANSGSCLWRNKHRISQGVLWLCWARHYFARYADAD